MADKPFPVSQKENSAVLKHDTGAVDSFDVYESIMNRFINDFFTNFDLLPLTVFEDAGRFVPTAYITHDPETIMITAELPGMGSDDIDIVIKSDMLIITGKKGGTENGTAPRSRQDNHSPLFFRKMIRIPCLIDASKAQAIFRRGILQIKLPKIKQEGAARFNIPIKKA